MWGGEGGREVCWTYFFLPGTLLRPCPLKGHRVLRSACCLVLRWWPRPLTHPSMATRTALSPAATAGSGSAHPPPRAARGGRRSVHPRGSGWRPATPARAAPPPPPPHLGRTEPARGAGCRRRQPRGGVSCDPRSASRGAPVAERGGAARLGCRHGLEGGGGGGELAMRLGGAAWPTPPVWSRTAGMQMAATDWPDAGCRRLPALFSSSPPLLQGRDRRADRSKGTLWSALLTANLKKRRFCQTEVMQLILDLCGALRTGL